RTPARSWRSTRTRRRRSSRSPTLAWWATCSRSCRSWKKRSPEFAPPIPPPEVRMDIEPPDTTSAVRISVVSPVYGCKGCLEELVDGIAASVGSLSETFEVILVDDGGPDGAWARIRELAPTRPWLRGLRLARNFGQHSAISAGIEHARGEWVVVMDCDLQDPPSAIPDLYRKAVAEGHDVVFAQRR